MGTWIKGLIIGLMMVGMLSGTLVTTSPSGIPRYQVTVGWADSGGGDGD